MKGWLIFVHSVRLVLSNIDTAFRISGVLYLILAALQYWFSMKYGPVLHALVTSGAQPVVVPQSSFLLAWFGYVIASLVITLWIAVAWHRYVLLEDASPGWIPYWRGDRILAYFTRSIIIAAAILLVVVIAGALVGIVLIPLGLAQLAEFIAVVAAAFIFYRFGAVLPAAALGKSVNMREAWLATAGEAASLFVLAVVTAAGSYLVQLPTVLSNDANSAINVIYSIVVGWFLTMIGVSVLTTIFGHFVEKRPID